MKAARFYKVGESLKIDTIPIPRLGSGDVLVNVKACGICGSDIHIVYQGVTPTAHSPITLGHEPSGVIARFLHYYVCPYRIIITWFLWFDNRKDPKRD
jgi:propanol-preferring alcohol dehydrogenase